MLLEMKKRVFIPGVPVHNYQKGYDGNVLFYCQRDRLVYFTIFCTEAEKHGIIVLSLCLMFTHTHSNLKAFSYEDFSRFNQAVCMKYAKAFNETSHTRGPVFMKSNGWAHKKGDAKVRENLAYLANNPVLKKLCKRGIDNRWTFLAYGQRDFPFSKRIPLRKASTALRRSIRLVKGAHLRKEPLGYAMIETLYHSLTPDEARYLTDYIIQTYSVIDYKAAAAYYDGFEKMIAAFDITRGSEYDISEEYNPDPDIPYADMAAVLQRNGFSLTDRTFLSARSPEQKRIIQLMRRATSATPRQIARFLHLPGDPISRVR